MYGEYSNISCLWYLEMDFHQKNGLLKAKIRSTLASKAEKNLFHENFFIWFLAKLGNSKAFGQFSFFGLFWPLGLHKGPKAKKAKILLNKLSKMDWLRK